MEGPKVIAFCIAGERFPLAWVNYWTVLLGQMMQKYLTQGHFAYSSNVYVTRNTLQQSVMEAARKPDYVLWLDDDQLVTFENVEQLVSDLQEHSQIDAVFGWTWIQPDVYTMPGECSAGDQRKGLNHRFTATELKEHQGLKEITHSGFPLVLMRYEVLERLGPKAFSPRMNPDSPQGFDGEDFAFCTRAREKGLRLFVDTRVHVPHLKLRAIVGVEPVVIPSKVAGIVEEAA